MQSKILGILKYKIKKGEKDYVKN
jgi:hypothetical protein